MGFEIKDIALDYMGATGLGLSLLFFFMIFMVRVFNFNPQSIIEYFKNRKAAVTIQKDYKDAPLENTIIDPYTHREEIANTPPLFNQAAPVEEDAPITQKNFSVTDTSTPQNKKEEAIIDNSSLEIEVTHSDEEEESAKNLSDKLVADFGAFDPTLDLSNYKFPSLDLLEKHGGTTGITINEAELEENKIKIVETLKNYSIGIAQIKATIGPTVTLYEIVPDAGVRISKIKT